MDSNYSCSVLVPFPGSYVSLGMRLTMRHAVYLQDLCVCYILSWNIAFPVLYSFKVASDAASLGLNTHIVCDAGITQIAPGSKTVLCVGPGKSLCPMYPVHLIPIPRKCRMK